MSEGCLSSEIDCSRLIRHEIVSSNGRPKRVIIDAERRVQLNEFFSGNKQARRGKDAAWGTRGAHYTCDQRESKSASTWEHVGQCLSSHSRQVSSRTTNFSRCSVQRRSNCVSIRAPTFLFSDVASRSPPSSPSSSFPYSSITPFQPHVCTVYASFFPEYCKLSATSRSTLRDQIEKNAYIIHFARYHVGFWREIIRDRASSMKGAR